MRDELKKTAEFKKTGIHINGKWLRASGFVEGQEFDLGQKGKNQIINRMARGIVTVANNNLVSTFAVF